MRFEHKPELTHHLSLPKLSDIQARFYTNARPAALLPPPRAPLASYGATIHVIHRQQSSAVYKLLGTRRDYPINDGMFSAKEILTHE
ncbi:hypothetical protein CBOM_02733 [Ceraceosorus bombacis]|uniref:Uncharacterized protein n=1 Tax=Ceraceosorus bombacis TaxID=401625 RepID=A0A0P1BGT3_9BASI|nr:hypothetical protein CBOM_02733 [Ceraceosorus bombacis]